MQFALQTPKKSWRDSFKIYWHPRILAMSCLGFAAGLPYLLVFSTLTAWLTEAGVSRASIGFFTWIGITYSVKVFWSPVVDRISIPFVTAWLGQRRSWLLFAQLMIAAGLIGMAFTNPATDLAQIALFAVLVAFGSATQDISIDAWRIEAAPVEQQAAMSAVYVFSYRIAMILTGAGGLFLASVMAWKYVYLLMAALVGVGICTVLFSREPHKRVAEDFVLEARVQKFLANNAHLPEWLRRAGAWLIGAVVCPFMDFYVRYGKQTFLLLLVIGGYRICDICMASMAMSFYLDMGFTKIQIAAVSGIWGVLVLLFGVFVGGLMVPRFGLMLSLLIGATAHPIANLLYSVVAMAHQPDVMLLATVIMTDNFCSGLAIPIFIAWMSSLTSSAYTATQYAVFSSLMTLPAKFIGGYSGIVVQSVGYPFFFVYVSMLGIPAILAVGYLVKTKTGIAITSKTEAP